MSVENNPIVDLMAQSQSVPTEGAMETTEQETSNAQEEQSEVHVEQEESNSQEQEVEATDQELETTNDGNSTEAETPQNEEGGGEAESQDETLWFEEDDSETTDSIESIQDYSNLSKALGVEGKTSSDIVDAFSNLRKENEEYKEKLSLINEKKPYANERIEKANEIAENGGDWEEYLSVSQTDWDAIDDRTLLVELELRKVFGEDVQAMSDYVNNLSETDLKLRGSQIRQGLKQEQQFKLQKMQQDAVEKKQMTDSNIRKALDSQDSMFGMKLTPSMRKEVYDDITSKNFLNSIFYDKDGKVNYKGMVEAAYLIKNIKKIMKYNMTKYTNKGVGDVMKEASNPKIRNTGELPSPKVKNTNPLGEYMQGLGQTGPQ